MTDISATPRTATRAERRRWYVHLGLLISLAGSFLSLIILSRSITVHVILGVLFMVMLLGHLYQRRRTLSSLHKRLVGITVRAKVTRRLAVSDTILELLVTNVLVSGIVDAINHQETQFSLLASIGFPRGLVQWHKLAAFVLFVYVIIHVYRRRKRLRRSRIQ
jgi:hypothetical protein